MNPEASTNSRHSNGAYNVGSRAMTYPCVRRPPMHKIEDLTERVERLLLRYEELQRTNALLSQELQGVTQERDSLKARLAAARSRIDALLNKLPTPESAEASSDKR
jgi:cell division protein ZapB